MNKFTVKNGMTPLHFAAMYGYLGIVRYLVEHGADINLQNEDHTTPLHFADIYGHSSTVRYLVMNNVNTNLEDISNNISQNYDVKFHCYDSARSLFSLEQGANVNFTQRWILIICKKYLTASKHC
ncbi:ankyrin repeat domain-containing protein [Wolbachia pipientis]|uniref:ankyrin repeat domain-containing protein n=1 Tax=Wolbachia pipientis TaxID=955 RepID=UPI0038B54C45